WARRHVGYLLDSIRLRGENRELVDEIVRLSMQYGIQTPYTSYLILEDGTRVAASAPARPAESGSSSSALALARENRGALAGSARAGARLKLDGLVLDRKDSGAGAPPAAEGRDASGRFGTRRVEAEQAERLRQNEAA